MKRFGNYVLRRQFFRHSGRCKFQRRYFMSTTKTTLDINARKFRYRNTMTQLDQLNPLAKRLKLDPNVMYLVSVPIGNLKDFTIRALEILREVNYIVCAHRDSTRYLLDNIDIDYSGRLIQWHDRGSDKLAELIKSGSSMCFVVPLGTPVVGDVGSSLVKAMTKHGIQVTAVPGASAVVAALSVSGIENEDGSFFFGGYLSRSKILRIKQLRDSKNMTCSSVFFENPSRLLHTLEDMSAVLSDRPVTIVHELTKLHESRHQGTAEHLLAFYANAVSRNLISKGELVIVIAGRRMEDLPVVPRRVLLKDVERGLGEGMSVHQCIRIVAAQHEMDVNELWDIYRQKQRISSHSKNLIPHNINQGASQKKRKKRTKFSKRKRERASALRQKLRQKYLKKIRRQKMKLEILRAAIGENLSESPSVE